MSVQLCALVILSVSSQFLASKIFKHKDRSASTVQRCLQQSDGQNKMHTPHLCQLTYRVHHVWCGAIQWQIHSTFFPSSPTSIISRYILPGMIASSDLVGDLYTAFPKSGSTLVSLLSVFTVPLRCGPGSSVGKATDYRVDGPGIESRWGKIFRPSGPALRPTQPPVQRVPGLSWG